MKATIFCWFCSSVLESVPVNQNLTQFENACSKKGILYMGKYFLFCSCATEKTFKLHLIYFIYIYFPLSPLSFSFRYIQGTNYLLHAKNGGVLFSSCSINHFEAVKAESEELIFSGLQWMCCTMAERGWSINICSLEWFWRAGFWSLKCVTGKKTKLFLRV